MERPIQASRQEYRKKLVLIKFPMLGKNSKKLSKDMDITKALCKIQVMQEIGELFDPNPL